MTGGQVSIGERTWVGLNTSIINNISIGSDIIIGVGSLVLIEAMSKIKMKYPTIKLLLVGEGPNYNSYKNEIKRLGLENNVYLLDYRNDLKEIIYLSDIGISSSKREGLGLFLIESLLLSKPVIGTDNRGSKEIIKDGENGFLVEYNSDIIADKIIQLYKDNNLYNSMVQNIGVELCQFEENNINEGLIKIYE